MFVGRDYQYIKILTVCLSVRVCVTEVGCSWGGTRIVTRDLRTIEPQTLEECGSRRLGMG